MDPACLHLVLKRTTGLGQHFSYLSMLPRICLGQLNGLIEIPDRMPTARKGHGDPREQLDERASKLRFAIREDIN